MPILRALVGAGRWLPWRIADARAVLELWQARHGYRRDLARLMGSGPHLIDDVGLLREHVEREVAKPFWRP